MKFSYLPLAFVLVTAPFSGAPSLADSGEGKIKPAQLINAAGNPITLSVLPGLCSNFVAELAEQAKSTTGITVFSIATKRITSKRQSCEEKGVPRTITTAKGPIYSEARGASLAACNAARDRKTEDACVAVAHTVPVKQ
ncbi:hypothetical protein C0U40_00710 [Amylibacter cionae]|nr:hypothetical protein C0U40_00710 [Amylibacter cionae]